MGDNSDAFPQDPTETVDTDGDGVGDNTDTYPNDETQSVDTTAPVVTAPADVSIEATGPQTSVNIGSATAIDDLDGEVSTTNDAPTSYPVETTTVTWSAMDAAGNVGSATQTVTVVDTTGPVVTPPPNRTITIEATGTLTEVELSEPVATDLVGVVSLTNDAPTNGYPIGTTTITWFASDAAGNEGTTTQTVIVVDTTAPVVTAPADITIEATAPLTPADIGTATATDAVGVVSITNNAPTGYPIGTTTITWSAADAVGNIGTATQTVIVLGPRDIKANLINDLSAFTSELLPVLNRIGKAIRQIRISLNSRYWLDAIHLDPRFGGWVFQSDLRAVKKLKSLSKKGASVEALAYAQVAIDKLVQMDRVLAETYIVETDELVAVTPKRQKKVDRLLVTARKLLSKGDAARDAGNPAKAARLYGNAWGVTFKAAKVAGRRR